MWSLKGDDPPTRGVMSAVQHWAWRFNGSSMFHLVFSMGLLKDPWKSHVQYCGPNRNKMLHNLLGFSMNPTKDPFFSRVGLLYSRTSRLRRPLNSAVPQMKATTEVEVTDGNCRAVSWLD